MPPEHSTQQLPEQFCVLGNTLWSAFVLLEKRKRRILRVVLHLFSSESMYKYVCNVSDPFNPFQPNICLVMLPTVCYTTLMRLVWRIWYQ